MRGMVHVPFSKTSLLQVRLTVTVSATGVKKEKQLVSVSSFNMTMKRQAMERDLKRSTVTRDKRLKDN